MATSSSTCGLCGLPILGRPARVPAGSPAPEGVDASAKGFCCAGCARVWSVAADNGMLELLEGPVTDRTGRDASRRKAAAAALAGARRLTLRVDGMWCSSCSLILETGLLGLPGVLDAEVSYASSLARVTYDPALVDADAITERVGLLGYRASPAGDPAAVGTGHDVVDVFLRFFVGAAMNMWVMWLTLFMLWPSFAAGVYAGESLQRVELLVGTMSLLILLYPGWPFLSGAWQAARVRRVSMDTLVVLGTWTAWTYSLWAATTGLGPVYFEAAGTITVIVLFGRWIEALGRASSARSVAALQAGAPEEVWLLADDGELGSARRVPVAELSVGAQLAVRPGERVPADGVVLSGVTSVDQSRLTGEPLPARIVEGDEVFAGTINVGEPVVMRVTRVGGETLAGRIAAVVEDAAFSKSNAQRLADMVAAVFVPAVIAIAAVTLVITWLSSGLPEGVSRAVAVLVVSCPCALGLATPLAVVNSVAAGSRRGLLIRGGAVLERAGGLRIAAFDKTGTLTEGRPSVTSLIPAGLAAGEASTLFATAAALESGSAHPVAAAIVAEADARGAAASRASERDTRAGLGIGGTVDGSAALVGSARFLEGAGVDVPAAWLEAGVAETLAGRTVVWVARGGVALGGIALADRVRPDAAEAVRGLESLGLTTVIVSGDSTATSDAVAAAVGASAVRAELLPNEKEQVVRELRADGPVMFVGDGINDAPALASADLAVALGGASDVALAASDVVLLGSATDSGTRAGNPADEAARRPLATLPALPVIARRARRIIRENLAWAFLYNLVAIPLAVMGLLNPIAAAAAMALSSIAVVLNSLRARRVPRLRAARIPS